MVLRRIFCVGLDTLDCLTVEFIRAYWLLCGPKVFPSQRYVSTRCEWLLKKYRFFTMYLFKNSLMSSKINESFTIDGYFDNKLPRKPDTLLNELLLLV